MHLPDDASHPTACARSHCSCAVHEAPTCPATGAMHVDCPAGHTVPVLQAPSTHMAPAAVGAAHAPHAALGAMAQNVVLHWLSSPHALPLARLPGAVAHAAPKSLERKAGHARALIACAQADVFAGVALVPAVPKTGTHASAARCSHVDASP